MAGPTQRQVRLAKVELRDAVRGGHPVLLVDGQDLGDCCIGYTIDRSDMAGPPILVARIAIGNLNEEPVILRPGAVAS